MRPIQRIILIVRNDMSIIPVSLDLWERNNHDWV